MAAHFVLFKRSEEAILRDIARRRHGAAGASSEVGMVKAQYFAASEESGRQEITSAIIWLEQLSRLDCLAAEEESPKVTRNVNLSMLSCAGSKCNSEGRDDVLRNASILGATCTKTYLSVKELGAVDMVIIDEASMVLLPMVWFAAGMAKSRVVVCGTSANFRRSCRPVSKQCLMCWDMMSLKLRNSTASRRIRVW